MQKAPSASKTTRATLLTVGEVAQRLGLGKSAIRSGSMRGALPWITLDSGRLRLRPEDLEAYLAKRQA